MAKKTGYTWVRHLVMNKHHKEINENKEPEVVHWVRFAYLHRNTNLRGCKYTHFAILSINVNNNILKGNCTLAYANMLLTIHVTAQVTIHLLLVRTWNFASMGCNTMFPFKPSFLAAAILLRHCTLPSKIRPLQSRPPNQPITTASELHIAERGYSCPNAPIGSFIYVAATLQITE